MFDLLVRNLDADVDERMRKVAEEKGKSLVQTAREALTEKFCPPSRMPGRRSTAYAQRSVA